MEKRTMSGRYQISQNRYGQWIVQDMTNGKVVSTHDRRDWAQYEAEQLNRAG